MREKVLDQVQVLNADFGQGNVQQRKYPASKSAVLSLLLSLHKQRKQMDRSTRKKKFRQTQDFGQKWCIVLAIFRTFNSPKNF